MDYKLVGAIGVLGIAASVIGLSMLGKKQKTVSSLKREVVIKILEELKHQVFMICLKSASVFQIATENLKKEKKTPE